MKRVIAAVVFLALMCGGAWADVEINEANFPDEVFRSYVSRNIDKDSDGMLSDAEIVNITHIIISDIGIESLKGIEYFSALTRLDCSKNHLTSLDVSGCTALTTLLCYSNKLTFTGLKSLNVSGCTALKTLYCYDNRLTVLDVSNNKALEYLYCYKNQLTSLDLSNCASLAELRCEYNNLVALDVSNNTVLRGLECYSNQLTSLDVSKNRALQYLYCYNNQLTTLDLSNCTALSSLECYYNQLTSLDLSDCTSLAHLRCEYNNLTALDVSNNTDLTYLHCYSNHLATLDLSNNTALILHWRWSSQNVSPLYITSTGNSSYPYQLSFSGYMSSDKFVNVSDVQGLNSDDANISTDYANGIARFATYPAKVTYNYSTGYDETDKMDVTISGSPDIEIGSPDIEINRTNFPDDVFRAYVSRNFDKDGNGVLSDAEIANVTEMNIGRNTESLKGLEYFKALTYLAFSRAKVTELDVSNKTNLTELRCYEGQLTTINLSGCTALRSLYCYENQLTSLDLSSCTALISVDCRRNQLTTLNVSGCTALRSLWCDDNQLTTLDVSKNTALTALHCWNNKLTVLDISQNKALTELWCNGNQLTALDVSNNAALKKLVCSDNQLTALDVSNNTALGELLCSNNKLATLDINNTDIVHGTGDGVVCNGQNISPLNITSTEDKESYHYQLDFSEYMSPDKTSHISRVSGFNTSGDSISTTMSDGIAYFRVLPSKVTYYYLTVDDPTDFGSSNIRMDVTISGVPDTPTINGAFSTGKVDETYSKSLSVYGGHSPYTWSYEGTLPDGTELNQNTSGDTYTLSGKPTKAGDYSFTVSVIDSYYQTASKDITVTISAGTPAPTPTPDPDPTPTPTPDPDPKPTPTPEGNNNNNTNNNTGNNTGNNTENNTGDNTNENTGENTNTPSSLSLNALNNIAQSLGSGSSTPSYIPESNMAAEQTPTPEITRAVSSDGYQIVSTQGSLIVPVSGSYAFPISVPYHFIGTRTVAKVYLARRGFSVGMVVNPSELPEDLVEAQIFTEAGEEVTTLPETIIAAANLDVSGPTTFSTHLATKVESSSETHGTSSSGGGCNSGFAVLGLAAMLMFRRKRKN